MLNSRTIPKLISASNAIRSLKLRQFSSKSLYEALEPISFLPSVTATIPVKAKDVKILQQPKDFYKSLIDRIQSAKERIVLSSLYIGESETELVDVIYNQLKKNPNLKVDILLDCLRGTRPSKSGQTSVLSLLPALNEFSDRFSLHLYHTPDLNGFTKLLIPNRFNEGVGLMHIKGYLIDNDLLLSGANLNNDYFKNRQDRYYWFNNSNNLSSYFSNLISTINSISYKVTPRSPKDYYLKITDEKVPDPVNKSEEFKKLAKLKLNNFLHMTTSESASQLEKLNDDSVDTVVFPTLQMKPLGIDLDSRVTKGLMSHLNQAGRMVGKGKSAYTNVISTSYFNLDPMYLDSILNTSGQFNVLTSAPEANGFYTSKGVSNLLPDGYTLSETQFLQTCKRNNKLSKIKLFEYKKDDWTFHAKGWWIFEPQSNAPFLTWIGSPNYNYRSVHRDLEFQSMLVTTNEDLQYEMKKELDQILEHCNRVDEDVLTSEEREPRLMAKILFPMVKTML